MSEQGSEDYEEDQGPYLGVSIYGLTYSKRVLLQLVLVDGTVECCLLVSKVGKYYL